ncbi:TetR/AcrR family transcriptional regulator [Microlunatus ginsengisoli]|uniref:HTH tetR-type domain-containing protein n=1 Tax=Microlunatus ginsengisoli TaxID=363863 RepID=A0ABP7AG86_9ACTN
MPRVTDAHRQARRDQIADAALRVLKRNGISDTSIAEIAEECGLSIGAIYVNFENKAALARYLANRLFAWRIEGLETLAASEGVHTPAELMRPLLASMFDENRPPLPVILQFWSEAIVDDDLHAVLVEQIEKLRASLERALRPWADAAAGGDGGELATRVAGACLIMCQGFLANRCLLGWMSAEEYLDAVTTALGAGADRSERYSAIGG